MHMSDLGETVDQLAKANGVRWHGHALKKDKNNFLRGAFDFEVNWTRKKGRSKKTWLRAVIEQSKNVGLSESDANSRSRWRLWVNNISNVMR